MARQFGVLWFGIDTQYTAVDPGLVVYLPSSLDISYGSLNPSTSDAVQVGLYLYNNPNAAWSTYKYSSDGSYPGYQNITPSWLSNGDPSDVVAQITDVDTESTTMYPSNISLGTGNAINLGGTHPFYILFTKTGNFYSTYYFYATLYLREASGSPNNVLASCPISFTLDRWNNN